MHEWNGFHKWKKKLQLVWKKKKNSSPWSQRHGSRKRRKTTLRTYLYLRNFLHKSSIFAGMEILGARASIGENVCHQKFIQRKTTWLWSGLVDLLTVSSSLAGMQGGCDLAGTTTWSSFKTIEPIVQEFETTISKVLQFLNGTIVRGLKMCARNEVFVTKSDIIICKIRNLKKKKGEEDKFHVERAEKFKVHQSYNCY